MTDDIDLRLLVLLLENARIANADIGRRVGLTPSAVSQRVKELEDSGVVAGYRAHGFDLATIDSAAPTRLR